MSNEHLEQNAKEAIERLPIERRMMAAKALGLNYSIPSPEEQIEGKGSVVMYKRTNANTRQKTVELPKVMLADGKTTTSVHIEPSCARAYAKELLRICDAEGL